MSDRDRVLPRRYRRLRIEPLEPRRVMSSGGIVRGDFNRDGQVTGADVSAMMAALTNLRDYQTAQSLSAAELIQLADRMRLHAVDRDTSDNLLADELSVA
jgi:Planctomycete extracellular